MEEQKIPAQESAGRLPVGRCVLLLVVAAALVVLACGAVTAQTVATDETPDTTAAEPVSETTPVVLETTAADETAATEPEEETTDATTPADTGADDVSCKGTYTSSDEDAIAAASTVVAVMDEQELTNAQLQVYYWMEVRSFLSNYGAYAAYFSLDYYEPLDTQSCPFSDAGLSWQQYFLDTALNSWMNYCSMAMEADERGIAMSEAQQASYDGMAADLEEDAVSNGYADAAALIHDSLGAACGMEDYLYFVEQYYKANALYNAIYDDITPTDDELKDYFEEHAEDYASSGITEDDTVVDVRHILIFPEGADSSNVTSQEWSDEAWAAAEAQAQEILDAWLVGDATEDSFAALANEYSQDGGSNTEGGLYTDVYEGEMVTAFNDWCFDAARQTGDTDIVKTEYGYHIMYFVSSTPTWKAYAESDYKQETANAEADAIVGKHTMSVNWADILLASVALA